MKTKIDVLQGYFKKIETMTIPNEEYKYTVNKQEPDLRNYCFFKLTSVMYDEKFPQREAVENVLATIENENYNFVYIVKSTLSEVSIYIGVTEQKDAGDMTVAKFGRKLESAFDGYFQGSTLEKLTSGDIQEQLLEPMDYYKRGSVITGIPTLHQAIGQKNLDFQGVDRLINGVGKGNWMLIVIAHRINSKSIPFMKRIAYDLYEMIHSKMKSTIQQSTSDSKSNSFSETTGESNTKGDNTSHSITKGKNDKDSDTKGTGTNSSKTKNSGSTKGDSTSVTVGKTISTEQIDKRKESILQYMDDEFFPRLKFGQAKGLLKTSIYVLGQNLDLHDRLKSNVLSVYQGDEPSLNHLRAYPITLSNKFTLADLTKSFTIPLVDMTNDNYTSTLFGMPTSQGKTELATYLTTQELSYLVGLPQKEIVGLQLKEGVDFGLNFNHSKEQANVTLGHIVNRGKLEKAVPISLTNKQINKHIFIAGVTGSGKTTTCQKVLLSGDSPFLVIEPAKTEYRGMAKLPGMEDLVIYTLGNEQISPFRLNPFELLKHESITSHIDMLKATFTAAFPMEAAMPQILEEAMYRCYMDCGWNIEDNTNRYTSDPWSGDGRYFPTLDMLVKSLKKVVESQGFGAELRDNYIGSLASRLKNLTIGSKGLILNCRRSIDFEQLLNQRVIIEMEDIKSSEDKALFMGLILSRIGEALKRKHSENKNYTHITLIEEAHRLLSKIEYGDAPSKKAAVETFGDMLAEVRKYGEGLVIVDQIPNKLASEVLKNTNTKIIHRIFARDDKEVIGDTMRMDDRQKDFLSSLPVGQAILFSEGMEKPIHLAVEAFTDTSNNEIEDAHLKSLGMRNKAKMPNVFYPLSTLLGQPHVEERDLRILLDDALQFFVLYRKVEDIYPAYELLRYSLSKLQKELQKSDEEMMELVLTYKISRENLFPFVQFDRKLIKEHAKTILETIMNENMTSSLFTDEKAFHYFNKRG